LNLSTAIFKMANSSYKAPVRKIDGPERYLFVDFWPGVSPEGKVYSLPQLSLAPSHALDNEQGSTDKGEEE
jgi:hypothetical protein